MAIETIHASASPTKPTVCGQTHPDRILTRFPSKFSPHASTYIVHAYRSILSFQYLQRAFPCLKTVLPIVCLGSTICTTRPPRNSDQPCIRNIPCASAYVVISRRRRGIICSNVPGSLSRSSQSASDQYSWSEFRDLIHADFGGLGNMNEPSLWATSTLWTGRNVHARCFRSAAPGPTT